MTNSLRSLAIRLSVAVMLHTLSAPALAAEPIFGTLGEPTQLSVSLANYPATLAPTIDESVSPFVTTSQHDDVEYPEPRQPVDLDDESSAAVDTSDSADDFVFTQYPDNWMWAAGGSPYRTGPGWLDDWKVGPIWDTSVDGMTLERDEADLAALEAAAMPVDPSIHAHQFDFGGGARLYTMGRHPISEKYQLQFGYEGAEEWNAALLFPELTVGVDTDGMAGDEYEYDETRSLHYRSSLHSAEMNFYRRTDPTFRPFWGVRYVRFADEITDTTDQDAPFPPPVNMMLDPVVDAVTLEDSLEYIDIKNNLVGFQLGVREDLWHLSRRVTIQGFVNAGVYYNHIQFADGSIDTTTTMIPDDGTTAAVNESQSLTSSTSSVSSSEPSDVAYLAEASITVVCRLNKVLALRGGYQLFWVDGLALAQDAFLGDPLGRHDFVLQGWHAGVEYRR